MFFSELDSLTKEVINLAREAFILRERTPKCYVYMKYPRVFPLMQFETRQYIAEGFGNITTFYTRAAGGWMQIATIICTPSEGANVPFLLIDAMVMPRKKKALCFSEFYDCTRTGITNVGSFQELEKKYKDYPDYPEKPAWYVNRRAPYSLIKEDYKWQHGYGVKDIVKDTLKTYLKAASSASKSEENKKGLLALQQQMVEQGIPSFPMMQKVLGKQEAEKYFRTVIMPVSDIGKRKGE